ncbi:MAG TPA: isochorismatase family cysteine hydrolase [Chloroflexia bacterium]|nr:isochorismatase family cysteine hydrolase [Chloroflexia bacterium]
MTTLTNAPVVPAARSGADLLAGSGPFLEWMAGWYDRLPRVDLGDIVRDPERTAVISVDLINGFCYEGPLSGPRVAGIVAPIAALMQAAHTAGVRRFVLTQDTHDENAPEFAEWGVHCVRGTAESATVAALTELPFAGDFLVLEKNSTSSAHSTGFDAWLDAPSQAGVDTFVGVGDCTDLCTYQLAMHLKLRANAAGRSVRVVLPEDCIQTYDLPVTVASQIGVLPHDGDLVHLFFLYHMALNGCEVVRQVAAV